MSWPTSSPCLETRSMPSALSAPNIAIALANVAAHTIRLPMNWASRTFVPPPVAARVAGTVQNRHSGNALREAIRKVAVGQTYLETKYLPSFSPIGRPIAAICCSRLTERDRAICAMSSPASRTARYAKKLQISEGEVKASLRLLFDKVNVKSRTQLVKIGLEQYQDQL